MDTVTRRRFLRASGVAGAAALAAGATGLGLAELLASAGRGDPTARRLVIVTLYGGNDGLNTVIPYADPGYRAARPELSYRPSEVLPLDHQLGLNPALPGLRRLWTERRLAVVLGVGYPRPDRSHFRSMDIWQTASPGTATGSGWIGRWLDATRAPVTAAVSFEPVLPPLLAGLSRAGACVRPGGLRLPAGLTTGMLTALGTPLEGEPELQARAASALTDLLRVDQTVRVDAPDPGAGSPQGNGLAAQLDLVARCVAAGVPTRVYSASLGGFDTHAGERGTQQRLLGQLDAALTGFADRMARSAAGQQVVTLVYSEFGRRVRANASDGTDHGTAGPLFVLGAPVAGGLFGHQPSLTELDDGDLRAGVDFRDVYAALLDRVLAADPAELLPGYRGRPLPLLRD